MTVTMVVSKNGEETFALRYEYRDINLALDYLSENSIQYQLDVGRDDLAALTLDGKPLILLDDTNSIRAEGMANFFKEYTFDYDEKVFNDLHCILEDPLNGIAK